MILPLLLAVVPAFGAEVGTYTTSTWYETISDSHGNTVWFQIHYPAVRADFGADADPSSGPYPLIGFMHGYLGEAWMYQSACDAFASMGFVVVNLDTQTGGWMDPYALADDTQTALEWVEARSAEPGHWLQGMAAATPWTLMGHSMGGIAMASLVDQTARADIAIGFAPYRDGDYLWDAYTAFGGSTFLIGGNEDETATPDIVSAWLDDVDHPARGLYALVDGAGHQAITDIELEAATLSNEEELAINIDLAATFLKAERFGDEQAYDALVCASPSPLAGLHGTGVTPATAAVVLDKAHLRLSLVGAADDQAVVYAGAGPGLTETPDGTVELDVPLEIARMDLPDGVACVPVSLPPERAGRAWLQVLHQRPGGPALGRVINLFNTEPSDTGDEPSDTDAADTATDATDDDSPSHNASSGCGCSTGATPSVLLLPLFPLALIRRRRS